MKTLRIKTLAFMSFFLSTLCFASEMNVKVDGKNYVIDTSRSVADVYEKSTEEDVTETALLAKILKAAIDAKQNELRSEIARLSLERDNRPTQAQLAALRTQLASMTQERDARFPQARLDELRAELASMTQERDDRPTQESLAALRTELASMTQERDTRPTEAEFARLQTEKDLITEEIKTRPTEEQLVAIRNKLEHITAELRKHAPLEKVDSDSKQGGWLSYLQSPAVLGAVGTIAVGAALAARCLTHR